MRYKGTKRPMKLGGAWAITQALAPVLSGTPAAAQDRGSPDPSRPECPTPGTTDARWIG